MNGDELPPRHRGSCLCPNFELRITERCLVNDLGLPPDASFEDALAHPIVDAFVDKRRTEPDSGKTVGPSAGNRTLRHLGRGDDHRGATWFDRRNRIVWLTAYGLHRSGEPHDAFQIFEQLIAEDLMRPKADDYRRVLQDRTRRFIDMAPAQASAAVIEAVSREGDVIEIDLAEQLRVRIQATIAGDAVELSIVFPWAGLNRERMFFIVRCFEGSSDEVYEVTDAFNGQRISEEEVAFLIWRPLPIT